jgi:hypothetical protein
VTIQFSRKVLTAFSASPNVTRSGLVRRLVRARQLKQRLLAGKPQSVVAKTVSKMEEILVATSSLVYAGYPYDPYA